MNLVDLLLNAESPEAIELAWVEDSEGYIPRKQGNKRWRDTDTGAKHYGPKPPGPSKKQRVEQRVTHSQTATQQLQSLAQGGEVDVDRLLGQISKLDVRSMRVLARQARIPLAGRSNLLGMFDKIAEAVNQRRPGLPPGAESFVEDIRENPADDDTPLIYADWLSDHGREVAGDKVRVAHRLSGEVASIATPAPIVRDHQYRGPYEQSVSHRLALDAVEQEFGPLARDMVKAVVAENIPMPYGRRLSDFMTEEQLREVQFAKLRWAGAASQKESSQLDSSSGFVYSEEEAIRRIRENGQGAIVQLTEVARDLAQDLLSEDWRWSRAAKVLDHASTPADPGLDRRINQPEMVNDDRPETTATQRWMVAAIRRAHSILRGERELSFDLAWQADPSYRPKSANRQGWVKLVDEAKRNAKGKPLTTYKPRAVAQRMIAAGDTPTATPAQAPVAKEIPTAQAMEEKPRRRENPMLAAMLEQIKGRTGEGAASLARDLYAKIRAMSPDDRVDLAGDVGVHASEGAAAIVAGLYVRADEAAYQRKPGDSIEIDLQQKKPTAAVAKKIAGNAKALAVIQQVRSQLEPLTPAGVEEYKRLAKLRMTYRHQRDMSDEERLLYEIDEARYLALRDQVKVGSEKARKVLQEALKPQKAFDPKVVETAMYKTTATPDAREAANEAMQWLRGVCEDKGTPIRIDLSMSYWDTQQKAYRTGTLNPVTWVKSLFGGERVSKIYPGVAAGYASGELARDVVTPSVVYAMGHALAANHPAILADTSRFVEYRCGWEWPTHLPSKFSDLGIKGKIYGRKDDFDRHLDPASAYLAGVRTMKDESHVLAVGLEALYKDPLGFMREDPEYAAFVIGVLQQQTEGRQLATVTTPASAAGAGWVKVREVKKKGDDGAVELGWVDSGPDASDPRGKRRVWKGTPPDKGRRKQISKPGTKKERRGVAAVKGKVASRPSTARFLHPGKVRAGINASEVYRAQTNTPVFSGDDLKALSDYTLKAEYESVNTAMRPGQQTIFSWLFGATKGAKAKGERISDAIARVPKLKTPIRVFRGLQASFMEPTNAAFVERLKNATPGEVIQSEGLTSTSMNPAVAADFVSRTGVATSGSLMLEIVANQGIYLPKALGRDPRQASEFMMAHGAKFRVVRHLKAPYRMPDGSTKQIDTLQLEQVGDLSFDLAWEAVESRSASQKWVGVGEDKGKKAKYLPKGVDPNKGKKKAAGAIPRQNSDMPPLADIENADKLWEINGDDVDIYGTVKKHLLPPNASATMTINGVQRTATLKRVRITPRDKVVVDLTLVPPIDPEEPNEAMSGVPVREFYNALAAQQKPPATEATKGKVLYSGVVLDKGSRAKLLKQFAEYIPKGWKPLAHHMTTAFGKALPEGLAGLDGELRVTHIGWDKELGVVAVQVESDIPSENDIPHITLAVSPTGKPKDSNKITNWKPVGRPLTLKGQAQDVHTEDRDKPKLTGLAKELADAADGARELAEELRAQGDHARADHLEGLARKYEADSQKRAKK